MAKKRKRKIKPMMKVVLLVFGIVILSFLWAEVKDNFNNKPIEKKEAEPKEEVNKLSLVMVGDSLIHSSVYDDAYEDGEYNFDKMLSSIAPIIKKHDLAFYNQESILGGTILGLSSYPAFNSPQEAGESFVDAGFNLVSVANNHTLDRGKKAVISSNNYWKTKQNVLVSGSYNSRNDRDNILIKEENGIRYALLAYTTTTNGIKPENSYHVNIYSKEQVKKDIEQLKDKVDLLMVSMHWGEEYNTSVTKEQEQIAEYLSSLGTDIIIGHHPHVVEPIDYIDDTLVIYSLGNFLSGQEGVSKRIGLMVSLDIEKKDNEVILGTPTATLTYTYYTSGKVKTNFKVYPFDRLSNNLLPSYQKYYNEYMQIVTSRSGKITKSPI